MSEIRVFQPDELDEQYWLALQGIARVALAESMVAANRDEPGMDAQRLVGLSEPERYYDSRVDPNKEVGRRYTAGQEYVNPRVAVAFDENDHRIGFAYAAHNVSGSFVERRAKLHMPTKRYLWLRDAVVLPEHQNKDIATDMVTHLLSDPSVDARQPVSAYVWPQLMPELMPILQRHGFKDRGSRGVQPFGTDETVEQHFMVAPSAGNLLAQLRS